ncbi:MAG: TldD/PmbA family protein [Firmicutes bacterium]|nr:TldD/PmbA family protein [Bacillota bacterium]
MSVTRGFDWCDLAIERGLARGAAAVEAFYLESRSVEVMVEKNDIHVPKGDRYSGIGLRVLMASDDGFKQGFASTNLLTAESIDSALAAAMAIAEASPADPARCLAQPDRGAAGVEPVEGLYDEGIAGMDLAGAMKQAGAFLEGALGYDGRVTVDSAMFRAEVSEKTVANSNGVRLSQHKTVASTQGIAFAVDGDRVSSFDLGVAESCALGQVDAFGVGRDLARRVVAALDARSAPSFRGKVLLTPYAALELVLEPIAYSCNAEIVQTGRSKWKGMLGKQVASPMVSVVDDPGIPQASGSTAFDREGVPARRLELVTGGVLQDYLYNCYTARRDGRESNGRASGNDAGLPGVSTTNMVLSPGKHSLEQLIAQCDRGLIVNRFSGGVDPASGDFSGVVKGGHYVEGGVVAYPVKEMMIAGNIYELLTQVVGLSDELWVLGAYRLPHILLDGCSITGK